MEVGREEGRKSKERKERSKDGSQKEGSWKEGRLEGKTEMSRQGSAYSFQGTPFYKARLDKVRHFRPVALTVRVNSSASF